MEKYSVLSDIHSKVSALKAVVKGARSKGVTELISLKKSYMDRLLPERYMITYVN